MVLSKKSSIGREQLRLQAPRERTRFLTRSLSVLTRGNARLSSHSPTRYQQRITPAKKNHSSRPNPESMTGALSIRGVPSQAPRVRSNKAGALMPKQISVTEGVKGVSECGGAFVWLPQYKRISASAS